MASLPSPHVRVGRPRTFISDRSRRPESPPLGAPRVRRMRPCHRPAALLSRNARHSATSLSSVVPTRPRCAKGGRPRIWRRTSLSVNGAPTAGPGSSGLRWPATRTRSGPPCGIARRSRSSSRPAARAAGLLRPFDGPMNTVEFFIDVEDVRRAQDGWEPRLISPEPPDALWARVSDQVGWRRKSRPRL